MILKFIVAVLLVFPQLVLAVTVIEVGEGEDGSKTTGQSEIWHDVKNDHSVAEVDLLYRQGSFASLDSAGSTGLTGGFLEPLCSAQYYRSAADDRPRVHRSSVD